MSDLYNAQDVIDKTLFALRDIPIYDSAPTSYHTPKKIGTVMSGNPVGIVYSYLDVDPGNNRATIWWIFYPATGYDNYYFTPQQQGYFDLDSLREQGVLTLDEKAEQAAEGNKEWYQKVLDQVLPVVAVVILAGAAIRGYFSRKAQ